MAWLIILGGLWTYPIITYFLFRLTSKRLIIRKYIFITTVAVAILCILGLLTNISTTVSEFDWLFITSFYFLTCLTLWWTQFQLNKVVKIIGVIIMFIVFGLGYFSSTVGALGVGFVTAEYETDREKWLDNGVIYKELTLGNAISDHRGKKVEINKTIKWFPVIEWRLQDKTYNNLITYGNSLTVDYKPEKKKIYLSVSTKWGKDNKIYNWGDTLYLESKGR